MQGGPIWPCLFLAVKSKNSMRNFLHLLAIRPVSLFWRGISCSAVSSTGFGISLHIILAARLSLTWEEMRRYWIKWENVDLRIGGFSKFEYKVNLSYLVGTARLLVLGRQGRERGLIGYYLPFVPKAVLIICACVVCADDRICCCCCCHLAFACYPFLLE